MARTPHKKPRSRARPEPKALAPASATPPPPEDECITKIRKLNPSLLPLLQPRDALVKLFDALNRHTYNQLAIRKTRRNSQRQPAEGDWLLWELVVLVFLRQGRLHEATALLWGLYESMLEAQKATSLRIHKGMPLVRLSDTFANLGFPLHAKRYMMLTLVEDALRENGSISPETTGTYFRLVWGYGMPHQELVEYARAAYQAATQEPSLAHFPEALLQEMDQRWLSVMPSMLEVSTFRINQHYSQHLVSLLGDTSGLALERLAEYYLSCIPGCRVRRRVRSVATDYDLVCGMEGMGLDFRTEFGSYFVCECKDWKETANFTTVAKFCRVLDSTKAKFGILFSKHGLSQPGDRERRKVFHDRGIVIVTLNLKDLDDVANGSNLVTLLRDKYEQVRLDLHEVRPSRPNRTIRKIAKLLPSTKVTRRAARRRRD